MIKLLPTNGQIYLFMMNLLHMLLTLCWVWSNFWTTVERCFMPPRSEFTCTHQIKPTLTLRSWAQHVFSPSTQKYANSYTRVAPIYPPNKNANNSPWELRIQLHSLHLLLWSSLPLVLSSATKEWTIRKKREEKNIWEKPKAKRGKSIPAQKNRPFPSHFLTSFK